MRHAHSLRTARRVVPALASLAAGALVLGALGCGGDRTAASTGTGDVGGTMVISAPTDADILMPPLTQTVEGKRAVDMLFDHLAEIGDSLNTIGDAGFQPRLAERWEWAPDSMSIAFHLNPKARWHDGVPVTAEDVRWSHRAYADPAVASPAAANVANVDSVHVRDSLTAVVFFRKKSPEQFFQFAYNVSIMPSHLLGKVALADLKNAEFGHAPVGSGRFRFGKWVPGTSLELVADTLNYRGRAKLDRVIVTVSPDFTAAVTKLYSGEADFFENLRADNLPELAKHADVVARTRPALDYGFLGFNLTDGKSTRPHPIFADRGVRRALTMAMDRDAMVKSVLDSLGQVGVGPEPRALGGFDGVKQLAYDTVAAAKLLDSLGWTARNAEGVRTKGGRPLAFTVIVPTSSKTRSTFALLAQEQLKRVGARVTLEPLEFNVFVQRAAAGDYDGVMLAWSTDPSATSSLLQTWTREGVRAKGGSNYGNYVNPAFEAQVDSASTSFVPAAARGHLTKAYQIAVDDAPAAWLYEPRPMYGLHKRIHPVGVRADAWWAGIADWTIPAGERIARDAIGLRAR